MTKESVQLWGTELAQTQHNIWTEWGKPLPVLKKAPDQGQSRALTGILELSQSAPWHITGCPLCNLLLQPCFPLGQMCQRGAHTQSEQNQLRLKPHGFWSSNLGPTFISISVVLTTVQRRSPRSCLTQPGERCDLCSLQIQSSHQYQQAHAQYQDTPS